MKAAILERIGAPLAVRDITPATHGDFDLLIGENQVWVKMLCAGICGSQIQEIDGIKGDPSHLPHLLGHEACGIVKKVGVYVKSVRVGDKVVLHWRKGKGGDDHGGAFGSVKFGPINTFSEYALVSENRVTKIDADVPNDFVALLGCALSTALAIIENEARPKWDQSVGVIGCGGVGLALILAAKMKCARVYATDFNPDKRSIVESLGGAFVQVPNPLHGEIIIDTVGGIQRYDYPRRKIISLQPGGTSAGGFLPTVDIPRYVQMWRDGLLNDYPKLITHRIKLDEINKGIQLMRDGKAGRVMIEFDQNCQHVPPCFDSVDACWNFDESKRRAMSFPNYP